VFLGLLGVVMRLSETKPEDRLAKHYPAKTNLGIGGKGRATNF